MFAEVDKFMDREKKKLIFVKYGENIFIEMKNDVLSFLQIFK